MAESGERRPSGALETEVMAVLQRASKPLATTDVQTQLEGELAYTTVVTILSRMHAKGLLERTKVGRAFVYAPVSDQLPRRVMALLRPLPMRRSAIAVALLAIAVPMMVATQQLGEAAGELHQQVEIAQDQTPSP